ncbi:hypothetical protein G6045_32210 [Streptomyces sp. YC504]|uniref:DUF7848 domain-containing protein n=1 Tax=Streptomyces mesophilus TaxID=1775132 RepID=A0A6G4XU37_9ACTN|nr:hypothetical protein [Streptomyces mesophilus]NGO80290.1 hypothetical protein [Streptomyces mesophilus]
MSGQAIVRLATWTIGPDRTPGASRPIRHVECTTCDDQSPAVSVIDQATTDEWATRHAGATGHTGYRETVTAFLRVTTAPGHLLHKETST